MLRPASNPAYRIGSRDTRPWGAWEVMDVGPTYVVKRLVVLPGQKLSLQRHQGREEHWVVVAGSANIVLDDIERTIPENGSAFIPAHTWHRLENPGREPLVVIEVEYGSDLREDDVERRDDIYGRV